MIKNLYAVVDRKLGEVQQVVLLQKEMEDVYFESFADDITNPLYRHLEDYDIYILAEIDTSSMVVTPKKDFVSGCMVFSDFSRRELSIMTQALNFVPNGYFRMSKEQQDTVKDYIIQAANDYVKDYLSKDVDKLTKVASEVDNEKN